MLSVDGPTGAVRIHYSDRGPNGVDQTDDDDDGIPDLPQQIAFDAEDVLAFYASRGFAPPLSDEETSWGAPGGNAALDIYLVDFTRVFAEADVYGQTRRAGCIDNRCAATILLSNQDGTYRPVAWEVFQAVELAYDGSDREPQWLRNGAATRMSSRFESDRYSAGVDADAYLSVADSALADAPVRIVGTPERTSVMDIVIDDFEFCVDVAPDPLDSASLLWWYFDDHVDGDVILATIEASIDHDGPAALDAGLRSLGTSLREQWPLFAAANVTLGDARAADDNPYTSVRATAGVHVSAEGPTIHDARTFQPLSAVYYRVDHDGGELWLGVSGDPGPLTVTVHPVHNGADDGALDAMRGPFGLPRLHSLNLGTYDAGGIWLSVSHPERTLPAIDLTLCIGGKANVSPCAMAAPVLCATTPHASPILLVSCMLAVRRRRRAARAALKPGTAADHRNHPAVPIRVPAPDEDVRKSIAVQVPCPRRR